VLRAFAPDVDSKGPWYVGKISSKNWKKAKEDKLFAEKFDPSLKICKNEGNVDVRNILSNSRKKS